MQSENRPLPLRIFLSFAYEDRKFRNALNKHLSGFQRAGIIDDLDKLEIPPGSNWKDVIDEQLDQADIILLIISSDFVASDYCYNIQMRQALEKHDEGKARVIPIRFRSVSWHHLPIEKLQGIPDTAISELRHKDSALTKIVAAIERAIKDLTADPISQSSATEQSSSHLQNIPHLRNPFFTARNTILQSLSEKFRLEQKNRVSTQVISGLGGIGKTQIALEYAYRNREDYHAIFWLKGDTSEDLRADFVRLATLLDLSERHEVDNQEIVISAIKRFLSQAPRWLMIIDNLDTFEQLDQLIPRQGWGDILITTRRQATGTIATLSKVEKLTPDEGALFLLKRAKLISPDASLAALPISSVEEAKIISESVDGHPLALDQAGAYIEETKTSLPRYIALYEKHEANLLKQRRKFATGHPDSIITTLALCIAEARQHNPTFSELLSICAFLHPDAIPIELLSTSALDFGPTLQALLSDELAFDEALETLLDLSLLHRNSDTETISIHRLVQVVLHSEMKVETQQLWAERVIKTLCRLFPESENIVWQDCQRYLPHALVAADLIKQWNLSFPEAARLLYRTSTYLYEIASYADAQRLCEQALTINERVHGDEHYETAQTLYCLGNIYTSLGNYPKAQPAYERALAIVEHIWGPEHLETARLLNDLGELFQSDDQLSLAEDYYRRALAIRQKIAASDDPATAGSLNNVAGICGEQGNYAEAERLFGEALALREHLRGPHHAETAETLSNIARFYRIIGKYPQARPLYEQAIASYEQALGPDHPRVATSCNNFAVFYIALGRYAQAEELLTRALKIRTSLLGLNHPDVAGSWNHLARVYAKQGHYEQAKELYERALRVREQSSGRKHASTALIITNIGELYLMQGDDRQAEALLTEALTNTMGEKEPETPEAAAILHLLGKVYLARTEYERAESILTQALTIRQESLGKTHPETGLTLKNLGDLALVRNDDTRAEVLYQQALDIVLTPLGPEHPDVAELVEHLTTLLQRLGREEDIRTLSERVRTTPSP
jgi:tetratricopeptide (TPR) repeat protein